MRSAVRSPTASLIVPSSLFILTIALSSGGLTAVHGADVPAERIAALVQGLGAASFDDRERASDELKRIGIPALGALRTSQSHADPEIRYRAHRLVDVIGRLDLEQRLIRFSNSAAIALEEAPLGWERFREQVGEDAASRKLFVEMQRAEPPLFIAMIEDASDRDGGELAEVLTERTAEYQFHMQNRAVDDKLTTGVAALLFADADPRLSTGDAVGNVLLSLLNRQEFRNALGKAETRVALRRVIGAWIASGGGSERLAYQKMMFSVRYDIPQGIVPALATLDDADSANYRQYALLTVGKLGTTEHVARVERFLDDDAKVYESRIRGRPFRCELGDVALAVAVHLTGQAHRDYGLTKIQKYPSTLFRTNTIGFEDDDSRSAARKRWREWRAEHPDAAVRKSAGESAPSERN